MKKELKFILILISLFSLCGCEKKKEEEYLADASISANMKKIICTYEQTDIQNSYTAKASIDVYSEGEYVTKLVSKETITSQDQSILDYMESTYRNSYDTMNEKFKGYDYSVTNKDGSLICDLTIDYTKVKLETYVLETDGLTKYFTDGKIKTSGIKEMYESLGASCK